LLLGVASPFCRHQHTFPEGRQYLDSHSLLMRDLGRHRGKQHCPLLSLAPITFDANTLSCYGGSYFATIAVLFVICRRPLNLVGPSMPTSSSLLITVIIARFQSMFRCRIVFCLYHLPPLRALQLSTPTLPSSFFRVTSHEHGACPPRLYTVVYFFMHVSQKVEIQVPFSSNGSFRRVPLLLSLTTTFSVEETLMDFGYTYAPNLIHQGASVITEISSAHGDKNSTSSKQQ
jgi:hypothetical protein